MTVPASVSQPDRIRILDVPVDRVTMDQALAILERFVEEGGPHLVVTADASGIVQAQDDPTFQEIFRSADLITPDSVGVLWAAKRQGTPIATTVSGVDLLERICALSADRGYRLYFLGAAPGVAELAAEKLRLKYPGCNIVGTHHGYFPPESDTVIAQEIAPLKPDFLFVAMGIPRQEKFIRATQDIIQASVGMGVGGSLDVFSGKTKRAPKMFQRVRLEWLWRLMLNPKKISKVKFLPIFVRMVLRGPR